MGIFFNVKNHLTHTLPTRSLIYSLEYKFPSWELWLFLPPKNSGLSERVAPLLFHPLGGLWNMIILTERRLSGDRLETNWSELRGFEAPPLSSQSTLFNDQPGSCQLLTSQMKFLLTFARLLIQFCLDITGKPPHILKGNGSQYKSTISQRLNPGWTWAIIYLSNEWIIWCIFNVRFFEWIIPL